MGKNNYKFLGKKFEKKKKLEDYYKKYYLKKKTSTKSLFEIMGEFECDTSFKAFCFVNEYIKSNDEKETNKNILKVYNEIFEYRSLRTIKKKFK